MPCYRCDKNAPVVQGTIPEVLPSLSYMSISAIVSAQWGSGATKYKRRPPPTFSLPNTSLKQESMYERITITHILILSSRPLAN
jgi:hypothetical protein